MKKFFKKLSIILLPVIFLVIGLVAFTIYRTQQSDNIIFKYYNKERLNKLQGVENKIIIIGGSNILFGIDPYLLEEKTGRKVVNLAYIRTIGVENMIRLAMEAYTDGDLIILSLAYGDETLGAGGRTFAFRMFRDPKHLLNTEVLLSFSLTGKKAEVIEEKFDIYKEIDEQFFIKSLDTMQNSHKEDFRQQRGYKLTYAESDLDIIERYAKKDLQIVAFHPPLVKEHLSEENINEVERKKTDQLPIKYITKQNDYIFSADSIYDFVFHLNADGRRERTIRLAKDINTYLK